MADLIEQALTRKKRTRRGRVVQEPPNEKVVYAVKFAIAMLVCLSAVEIAHLAILRVWNSEVFSAITGLVGTVTGIFLGQKA